MQKGLPLRSLLAEGGQILIWIIVGGLIIMVAGGAYYLGRSTSLKPTPTVISQTPQPTLTPASTPDETANSFPSNYKL